MSFESLGLCDELLQAISEQQYKSPTPIQQKAIPVVLQGCDVLAGAQTGTGKTAAFTLPLLHRLHASKVANGKKRVEEYLAKEMRLRGEAGLNSIRDEAKEISNDLGFQRELKLLNKIISALLQTEKDANALQSTAAKAMANKEPFDDRRIELFNTFTLTLKKCFFADRNYNYTKQSFRNLSFFESYFSNFIEGTEFLIDEAEDIVFKGQEIQNRHADSHDVLSHYTLSNDYHEMIHTPDTHEELIHLLKRRHKIMMAERPEKHPGEFKQTPNRAGNTLFVLPEDVIGTLIQGFDIYQHLEDGLEKALFMHLLISEVHPFDDGNGRLSRIMMNAELVNAGLYKIIIPTVHRDNYLNGLRLVTRDQNFQVYCKVMDQAQAYTESVNWQDYGEARLKIENDYANKTADEGLPIFNRALRGLAASDIDIL